MDDNLTLACLGGSLGQSAAHAADSANLLYLEATNGGEMFDTPQGPRRQIK